MNIKIIDTFGNAEFIAGAKDVPRIGDKIEWKFEPHPTVVAVLWSADLETVIVAVE